MAIDLSNISLSSNIGDIRGGSSGNQYFQQPKGKPKQQEPSKLRVGEIVRGEISERIDEQLAFVKIPTGMFKAIVGKNLTKGDILLFKVLEVSPQLVLKVHEVSVRSNNKKLESEELLRILDIPQNDFYLSLIDLMSNKKKSILRDDIVDIYKTFIEFDSEFTKDVDIKSLQQIVIDLQLYKVPLSVNLIYKLFPLYSSENTISKAINSLASNLDQLPENLKLSLTNYFEDIKANSYNKNNIFMLKIGDGSSFYENLIELSGVDLPRNLQNQVNFLRDLISSLSLWNIISFSGKTPFHYIIPYYIEGDYYVIRMVNKDMINDEVSFYFSVPSESLGEVSNKVIAFQKQLQIYMKAESERIKNSLDQFKQKLNSALTDQDFKIDSLKIGLEDIQKELNQLSRTDAGDHFTIVV